MKLSFPALLTLLFIALKLTNHIDWSWWWVLAPSWITISLGLVVSLFAFVMAVATGQLKIKKG